MDSGRRRTSDDAPPVRSRLRSARWSASSSHNYQSPAFHNHSGNAYAFSESAAASGRPSAPGSRLRACRVSTLRIAGTLAPLYSSHLIRPLRRSVCLLSQVYRSKSRFFMRPEAVAPGFPFAPSPLTVCNQPLKCEAPAYRVIMCHPVPDHHPSEHSSK